MFETFDDCLRALLSDQLLNTTKGGSITKHGDEFQYRLYGGPTAVEGETFFELAPSTEEGIDWIAWPITEAAQAAYDSFESDPRNGLIVERLKVKL
jgi:hypothetical protein